MMKHPFDRYHVAAIVLAFFAFVMSAWVSDHVFERLPHLEDEMAYNFQARVFANGDVVAPILENSRAYWQPFVITYRETDARFGKYHPGWPALLSIGIRLEQAWVVNAFSALFTVGMVYRLGRDVFNKPTGLIAAGLLAFSPMALLLNGTLMPHPAALTLATAFILGYRRLTVSRRAELWAVFAGCALGFLLITRPSSAVAIAFPFVVWTALYLSRYLRQPYRLMRVARPYVILALCASAFLPILPLFNYLTTGDATKNLYTLVWDYDRIGFGEGYGSQGHSISTGVLVARHDLSMMAVDLFGLKLGSITTADGELNPIVKRHLLVEWTYYPVFIGLSFFVVFAGVFIGFRKNRRLQVLFMAVLVWFGLPLLLNMDFLKMRSVGIPQSEVWAWLGIGVILLILPVFYFAREKSPHPQTVWTWLLGMVAVALILIHMAYWVGAQRYSTRYYFEAVSVLCVLGALPLSGLIQRVNRVGVTGGVYVVLLGGLLWGFYTYSMPRIQILHGFNRVDADVIERVEARRVDDRPILVIARGENLVWRSYGALMAITDPYLQNDIIAAWDYGNMRDRLMNQHPERQVIDIVFNHEDSWFADCYEPDDCRLNPPPPQLDE